MINLKTYIKNVVNTVYAILNYVCFLIRDYPKIKNCECLFFFPYYHTGGAEKVHINILNAISEKKCTVVFTMGSATKSLYNEFRNSAKIVELNSILNKRNKWINEHLQKSIVGAINKKSTVKIVFGCNNSYYYQLISNIKATINKFDLFHAFEENDSRISDVVSSVSSIDKRIVINLKAKNDIIAFYKSHNISDRYIKNIKIIQNGIELSEKIYSNKNDNAVKVGFVGRWSHEKRPELFLEIAKKIQSKVSNIEFVMVGTGMKNNIDLINKAAVNFLGEITNEEKMIDLYKSLHFIAITSTSEGFPMVVMEAMSHGVIPISTNVGGIYEHIAHQKNGLLVNAINEDAIIDQFCEAVLYLTNHLSEKNKMSKAAFDYARENFGIEKFNKAYQELLLQ